MNTKRFKTSPIEVDLGEEQDAMAIAAIRSAERMAPTSAPEAVDRCPYCGRKSLMVSVESWGGGHLNRGACAQCGTTTVAFSAFQEPLSLPWSVPAMSSSVA
jgi:hypothetical protein